jgi:transposase
VRGRLLVRDALVRTRTRSISLIRALLRQHGYRVPSGSAEAFHRRVRAVSLPGRLLSQIAPLLAVMRHVNHQLVYADQVIEHISVHDPRVQRLRTVPSVGPVTAAAFVATIDDAQRFGHAHQVEAYLGLVPRELSSGESQRRGPITKAGHAHLRRADAPWMPLYSKPVYSRISAVPWRVAAAAANSTTMAIHTASSTPVTSRRIAVRVNSQPMLPPFVRE